MQNAKMLSLILGLLSVCAYAQPRHGNQEYDKCSRVIGDISFKFGLPVNPGRYCSNINVARPIINDAKKIEECVATIIKSNVSDPIYVCTSDQVRISLKRADYQDCLVKTENFDMGDEKFKTCFDKDISRLIQTPAFTSCFQSYREGFPGESGARAFNYCRNEKNIANINGESFNNCRMGLVKLGVNTPQAFIYCMNESNQNTEALNDLKKCSGNLDDVFPGNSINYCMAMSHSLHLVTHENVLCFNELKKKHFDKTYFSDEGTSDIVKTISDLLTQCQDSRPVRTVEDVRIKLSGIKIVSSNKIFQKTLVGGLSGLSYDKKTDSLLVVSDDPGLRNSSRFYQLNANFSKKEDALDFIGVTKIDTMIDGKDGIVAKKVRANIDAEGLTILPNGDVAISSETLLPGPKNYIRLYRRDGSYKQDIVLPEKFIPAHDEIEEQETLGGCGYFGNGGGQNCQQGTPRRQTRKTTVQVAGVHSNKAFEALTSVPGKKIILTANESPLVQDKLFKGKIVRIVRLAEDNTGNYVADAEFAYPLDNLGENGLVELVALNDSRILTLERNFDPFQQKITAAIYEVNISNARNYIDVHSFKEEEKLGKVETLNKKLLLNLDNLLEMLPKGIRKIDNFEGMALGPKLPNGKQSLILVTDNNFANDQLTQILVLELNI